MSAGIEQLKKLLANLAETMKDKKQALIELDSVMGDGDLGLTMEKAFCGASQKMSASEETDIGKFLFKTGVAMAEAAPSTMGTLMGSGFMEAGKKLRGRTCIAPDEWAIFAAGLQDGIARRGKARVGEKTILDVLAPVASALEAMRANSAEEILKEALLVAERALEQTKTMQAQHGRAVYYGNKSIGHQDAGATVGYLMYKSLRDSFRCD